MRQRLAILVAMLAVTLLASLATLFARAQNPTAKVAGGGVPEAVAPPASIPEEGRAAPVPQPADSVRGRAVFDSVGCTRCHSVAGVGSPRYPLDGVGSRRSAAQLRAWTQGAAVLADSLPPSALRAKQAFRTMRPADLDVLIAYLLSLKRQ